MQRERSTASSSVPGTTEGRAGLVPLETDVPYVCPYCGEENQLGIDPSGGSEQRLIEDCPVCCSPIAFRARVDRDGDVILESAEAEG
jgi:hypothetical protein